MERAELSEVPVYLSVCKANEKAYQKFGPFSCPSELSGLVKCLPKLFETDDMRIVQINDLEIRVKMPRLTGERNLLIVDLPPERNGEITVFAIDNLPAEDNINIFDILCILEQTTGQDVRRGRILRTINGEEVDLSDEECCLNGGVLIISSAPIDYSLEETPLIVDPPTESIGRGAQLRLDTVEDTEIKNVQSDPAAGSPRDSEGQPPTYYTQCISETDEDSIGDACIDDTSGSSSPLIMPPEFEPFLSSYTYESDSMEEFPQGQEEVNHTAGSTELPTAEEIYKGISEDEEAKKRFRDAYYESFSFRERGGWIYVDRNNPTQPKVVLAPKSASKSFYATDTTTTPSIDLNNIPTDVVPPGYILVATFHTHPLYNNEKPSKADIENAYYRGMPGIVISRTKIFGYGPERRVNTAEPLKYAPPMEYSKSLQSRKLINNPFPLQ